MKKSIVTLLVLCSCLVVSQNARAEANLGLKSAGVQVGMVSPQDLDTVLGFGGFADWGMLTPNIGLTSNLDYWSKSESDPTGSGATASVSDIALTMRGKYMFQTSSPKFQPYAGVGLGMHFLSAKVEMPGFPTMSDGTTKLGLDFGGGFTSPLNERANLIGEAWYGIVDGFNQFSIKAGVGFKLGQ